jgi:hypothetical protein
MITNLFVQFPQNKSNGQLWEFAWSQIPLALHIIIGILLLICAIFIIIKSIQQKNRAFIIISSFGGIAILLAGMFGAIFITTQLSIYSFIMSLSFLIALISYGWGFYSVSH